MAFGDVAMGLGEYLTLWTILGALAVAVLAWGLGVALGGAILFFVAVAVGILLLYALLSRGYRFLLHGSISAGDGGGEDL